MVDSKAEIYGHMGVDFPPVPLLKGEIQIHKDMAQVLDLAVDDKVQYIVNGTRWQERLKMFALMTAQMDDVYLDFSSEQVVHFSSSDDESSEAVVWVPFSDLGLSAEGEDKYIFDFEFTVKSIYDDPAGKYGV